MSDLERQLRAYAEQLDEHATPLDELAERATTAAPTSPQRRPATWLIAAGAAAVAVVAVGSIAVLSSLRAPDDATASTSTQPSSTVTTTVPEAGGTPTFTESPYVELVSDVPVYAGGPEGDVGHPMVGAGPVAIADGAYHTLFAAGGEDETWDAVYHAQSSDGSEWVVDSEPVELPGVEGASTLAISSLIELDDGSWVTYFHLAFDVGGHGNHIFEYEIRAATASDPAGPWTMVPEPLLLPGEGTWDGHAVTAPNVSRDGDTWVMFYTGYADEVKAGEEPPSEVVGASAIGRATSSDGLVWVKDPLPVFTGSRDLAWEDGAASKATVARDGDLWIMLYAGRTGGSRGLATSTDGISWQRVVERPVLTSLDVPRPAIFTTSLLVDGGYRLYVANGGRRTTSSVFEMRLSLEPSL